MSASPFVPGHVHEVSVASSTATAVERQPGNSASIGRSLPRLDTSTAPFSVLHCDDPSQTLVEDAGAPLPTPSQLKTPSIPPANAQRYRTLVLCFDGTGNEFAKENSNVIKLFSLLKKDDPSKQMVYYQTGIGTAVNPHLETNLKHKVARAVDGMIAWSLDHHVMGGYEFLMQNYTDGDRICLFGFSRGAYTARALAGMLHKVGLLPAGNFQQVPYAYNMYSRADDAGWTASTAFKKAFCTDVDIEFIGVWDTVNSVGLISRRLPFTTSNTIVRTFRHAVALDERRAKFKANLWNVPDENEATMGDCLTIHPPQPPTPTLPSIISNSKRPEKKSRSFTIGGEKNLRNIYNQESYESGGHDVKSPDIADVLKPTDKRKMMSSSMERELSLLESKYSSIKPKTTDVLEVWFAGCHADVGGGSVPNEAAHALSRIPLRWMIRECFKTKTGIMFIEDRLISIGLKPSTLYPIVLHRPDPPSVGEARVEDLPSSRLFSLFRHLRRAKTQPEPEPPNHEKSVDVSGISDEHEATGELKSGTEEVEELRDALTPKYDQLKIALGWWVLEILPLKNRCQRKESEWYEERKWNLGRPRLIPKQETNGLRVHRSVKMRMEAPGIEGRGGKKYKPKPVFKVEPKWVD